MSSRKITQLGGEIAKYVPDYEGPARGRARQGQFSHLNDKDRKKVQILERELKLEKNKLAARIARLKKNQKMQYLIETNEKLKIENSRLMKELASLKKTATSMKFNKRLLHEREKEREMIPTPVSIEDESIPEEKDIFSNHIFCGEEERSLPDGIEPFLDFL